MKVSLNACWFFRGKDQVAGEQFSLLLFFAEESVELLTVFSTFSEEFFVALFFVVETELLQDSLLYPSAYQPPPFNWKELLDISFLTDPEHSGQEVKEASVIR
jgi:hypothetical protein